MLWSINSRANLSAPTSSLISPNVERQERVVRDLLRKRGQMVRQRTTNLLSIQNLIARNTGCSISSNRIKTLNAQQIDDRLPNPDLALAVKANLAMMKCADEQIDILERTIAERD